MQSSPNLQVKLFTPPSEAEAELFEVLPQALRVARGFAKRRGKSKDAMFVDECEAEATFVVTELIYGAIRGVMEKFADKEERFKFYRMSVGYKLKEYYSYRATSTVSYLKKKGIEEQHIQLQESHALRVNIELECLILMDYICRDEIERRVVDFYAMGNPRDLIASKCGMSVGRVKRILRRVKRRLKESIPSFHTPTTSGQQKH